MAKLPPPPFFGLRGHEGCITALHFTNEVDEFLPSNPSLISGSQIGEIFIWNLRTFRTAYRFKGHEKNTILYLNYYKSSLISQGRDGLLNVWKCVNQQWTVIRCFPSISVGFCAAEFYLTENNTEIVLYNDEKHTFEMYDYEKENNMLKALSMKDTVGMCMCIKVIHIKTKSYILAGYESGHIGLWDCESNCEVSQLKLHEEPVMCLDYDFQHRNRGISGSVDKLLNIWKIAEDLTLSKVNTITIANPGITSVKIRGDGKVVICGGSDSNVWVYSWKSLNFLAILNFHQLAVQCLSHCPVSVGKKASVFASGSKDKCIALWSLY